MNKKATDIVSYLGPIGFLISYFVGARNESMFHLNQSLVLIVCNLALSALSRLADYIPLVGGILQLVFGIASLVVVALWFMGIFYAITDREKPVPLVGWVKLI